MSEDWKGQRNPVELLVVLTVLSILALAGALLTTSQPLPKRTDCQTGDHKENCATYTP